MLAPLDELPLVRAGDLSESDLAIGPMRKCISLGGPGPLRRDDDPDDYRLWGNREYIRASGTTWVKVWLSWSDLQGELDAAPATKDQSWDQLSKAPNGQAWIKRLDRQLAAINSDGLGAILTLFQSFPRWAGGATGPDPVTRTKPPEQKIPSDLSPGGPWGWFVGFLCDRYGKDSRNNPDGAWVDALEICNEPNLLWWPQEEVGPAVAQMIRTATELSGWDGPAILAPGTSDFPDQSQRSARGLVATDWLSFTQNVLENLRGLRLSAPLHWSHHNFNDVKRVREPSRAEQLVDLLAQHGWIERVQPLWLTEGGFNLHPDPDDPQRQARQAKLIEANYLRMLRTGDVFMWTQHTITDKPGNDFNSGLRDDFVEGRGPGPTRPAWGTWQKLPGAKSP